MGYDPKRGGFCERKNSNLNMQSESSWWILSIILICGRTVRCCGRTHCNPRCCGWDCGGWSCWVRFASSYRTLPSSPHRRSWIILWRCFWGCRHDWRCGNGWWSWRLTCFRSRTCSHHPAVLIPALITRRFIITWSICGRLTWSI